MRRSQADPSLAGLRTPHRRAAVPRPAAGHRGRAQAGRSRVGWTRRAAAYLAAIEASPDSPFLHRELADVERRAGRLDAALEHASQAAALEPDEPRTHVLLGEIYEAQGDVAKAAEEFTAAAGARSQTRR